jgi:GAF domain-containing protein/HAMP domain-containing protein
MINHFLQKIPVNWRILGIYLLIVLGVVLLAAGGFLAYQVLVRWMVGLTDLRLEQLLVDLVQVRLQVLTALGILLIVFGLVAALLVNRSLSHQLHELRQGIEALRSGRGDVHLPMDGMDEIGLLARSINQLGEQLDKTKLEQEKKIEERTKTLREYTVQLQTISEMAQSAATQPDLDALTERSVQLILNRFNFYYVAIYLLDDERNYCILKAATGSAGGYQMQRGVKLHVGEVNVISNVVGSGDPRIINDTALDFVFRKDPLLPETQAEAVIPLRTNQVVIGVLDVQSSTPNVFGEDEVIILQILADQLTIAIQNALLAKNLKKSMDEANSLYQRYTQTIWSREAMGKRISGYEYNLLDVMPVDRKLPEEVLVRLQSGKATPVSASEIQDSSLQPNQKVLLVPLMMYNQMVGVIGLEKASPDLDWTDDEITVVEAVTSQVALSLDNARLLEESQIRSGQLRLLQEITAVAASHTNLLELLDNVSQKLRASFNLLHCGMFLLEPDGQFLNLVANASTEPYLPGAKLIGTKILFERDGLIYRVFRERRSRVIYDARTQSSMAAMQDFIKIRGVETIVFMPLLSRGEVIGMASLELSDKLRQFSEEDIQLIDQISLQLSSAIDMARSFEQATLRAERERRVGDISSRIRETLDIQTILKTAAQEVRQALGVPEVTVRLASSINDSEKLRQ